MQYGRTPSWASSNIKRTAKDSEAMGTLLQSNREDCLVMKYVEERLRKL
jgi:hypothetical protein